MSRKRYVLQKDNVRTSSLTHRIAGMTTGLRAIGPGLVTQETVECSACKGSGHIFKEKDRCKKCKGQRVIEERKVLEIYIPRGSK